MVLPYLLKAFITLFVVIDPIGLLPIFISLTSKYTPVQKQQIASQAILVSTGIFWVFSLTGNWLMQYLGISMEAFQIAAGLLLLKIGMDMVFAHAERETQEEEQEALVREDVSVFPLAIPLIAGPGALASILVLTREMSTYPLDLMLVLTVVSVVLIITYVLFLLASPLANLLGKTGINVVTRILGVLLAALAIQYMVDGASTVLTHILSRV